MAKVKQKTDITSGKDDPSVEASPGAVTPQRILVAEDNEVTHDLLELLLTQRGHEVDVVTDGEQALKALHNTEYDVVLMDFHLPKMDGLEVTAAFRSSDDGGTTRFVAITADMKGLLDHAADCENFDDVMAKPFGLEDVVKVVEGHADASSLSEEEASREDVVASENTSHPAETGNLKPAMKVPVSERESQLLGLDYEFLRWPDDFNGSQLSARVRHASLNDGAFDAVLVRSKASADDLNTLWRTKALQTLPIIDLTGSLGGMADIDASKLGIEDTEKVDRVIQDFRRQRNLLHRDFIFSEDIGEQLMSRIFVSGEQLKACHDPQNNRFISFNAVLETETAELEAEKLFDNGFLQKEFFDRLHICDRCSSSRFNIREECSDCRSPNLTEEPYLHHFKCAYQGLESDFRDGEDLICPKCRRELSHYSIDYDKPGTMIKCETCDHTGSEPSIGLLCIDCGAHTDGDVAQTRDVYSYTLTNRAMAILETGRELLGKRNKPLQFAELPLELVVAINGALKKYDNDKTPFTVLDLSYRNGREIELEHGARQFQQTRSLFLENLGNVLNKGDKVVKGQSYDFALITGSAPEQVRENLKDLRKEATEGLRLELDVAVSIYGPESFA